MIYRLSRTISISAGFGWGSHGRRVKLLVLQKHPWQGKISGRVNCLMLMDCKDCPTTTWPGATTSSASTKTKGRKTSTCNRCIRVYVLRGALQSLPEQPTTNKLNTWTWCSSKHRVSSYKTSYDRAIRRGVQIKSGKYCGVYFFSLTCA